jgi:segregation and condensation protein B
MGYNNLLMTRIPAPSSEPNRREGISLDELSQAFAQVMGAAPRARPDDAPADDLPDAGEHAAADDKETPDNRTDAVEQAVSTLAVEDACPISPTSILEAVLFVGNRENEPLSALKAAELMRDVSADEIPALADQLNRRYEADGRAYQIVHEGGGYRLALKKKHAAVRNRFYGRMREARLSQAAIDVLAIAAYQQPISSDRVNQLRGKPSSHILVQLVRRGLLRIERPEKKRRKVEYYTTDRFLKLFKLKSLGDLPRSEDAPM